MTRNQRLARMLRGLTGLSQGQLARKAGLNPNRVAAIEAGELEPMARDLQRIAEAAGMAAADADQLMRIAEAFIRNRRRQDQGSLEALPALMDLLKLQLAAVFLRLLDLPGPGTPRAAGGPEHVEDMMNRLRPRSHEVRVWIVRTAEELQCWELCERVCDEAVRVAADNPEVAAQWAELAEEIAEQLQSAA